MNFWFHAEQKHISSVPLPLRVIDTFQQPSIYNCQAANYEQVSYKPRNNKQIIYFKSQNFFTRPVLL